MNAEGIEHFNHAVRDLPGFLKALEAAPQHRVVDHPAIPKTPGIYLFSDADGPIYVGQTRSLQTRLKQHTGATSRSENASFAFNVAKREAASAGVDVKRFRKTLEADPAFVPHFSRARTTVANMRVQFIEMDEPITRYLFELYAALALGTTEFNTFETH